jgi:hypothetical protein
MRIVNAKKSKYYAASDSGRVGQSAFPERTKAR